MIDFVGFRSALPNLLDCNLGGLVIWMGYNCPHKGVAAHEHYKCRYALKEDPWCSAKFL